MANYITTDTELTSVANAIRTKGGTSNQLEYPAGFVSAIENIPSGGGTSIELSGDLSYFNYNGQLNKVLYDNKDNVEISNITSLTYAFANMNDNNYADLSFLDGKMSYQNDGAVYLDYFGYNSSISKLPIVLPQIVPASSNLIIYLGQYSFSGMAYLQNLDNILKEGRVNTYTNSAARGIFQNCSRLRSFNKNFWSGSLQNQNSYREWFVNCLVLDSLENIPVIPTSKGVIAMGFTDFCYNCNRLNKLTFATDNGTPYDININRNLPWDLSVNLGYSNGTDLTTYGMPAEKEVTDATSYNLLKNDPDWWTKNVAFSRFNHDSAVALINSLPSNTNNSYKVTIKLKGDAGSATDGGAISTLTAEEIAVATNKKWTISIV